MADQQAVCIWFSKTNISKTATHKNTKNSTKKIVKRKTRRAAAQYQHKSARGSRSLLVRWPIRPKHAPYIYTKEKKSEQQKLHVDGEKVILKANERIFLVTLEWLGKHISGRPISYLSGVAAMSTVTAVKIVTWILRNQRVSQLLQLHLSHFLINRFV